MTETLRRDLFGMLADGTRVEQVTLASGGIVARIIGWGATLQSLDIPDRDGTAADVVLGYATLEDYVDKPEFFGSTVGRYANRLALGRFSLDGRTYQLARTDPPNTLHGGTRGFDKRVWQIAGSCEGSSPAVTFRRTSPDGEEGFPGTLTVDVTYTLDERGMLTLTYEATTDASTVLNLTNHTYFNLCGEASGRTACEHLVRIEADHFTPIDVSLIPTGEIAAVDGSPLDFRSLSTLSSRLRDGRSDQLVLARGYDHNMVLRGGVSASPKPAVRVEDPITGRVLDIATTEPGVQFYSGNFLDATKVGKGGNVYRQGDGIAFETQHFPDSPNQPHFPSTRLEPGQTFRSTTTWSFSSQPQ